MIEKIKEKIKSFHWSKKYIILVSVLGFTVILGGTSYAYWIFTKTQTNLNIAATDCFELTLKENSTGVSLSSAKPTKDSEGLKEKGYSFTIKNTCTSLAKYEVNLESVLSAANTKRLDNKYIKVSLNNSTPELLTNYEAVKPTLEDADTSFKLTSGSLNADEKTTYELKLWMDYDTPADKGTMNAKFESKISVIGSYIQDTDKENEILLSIVSKSTEISKNKEIFTVSATSTNKKLIEYSVDGSSWTNFSPTNDITFDKEVTKEGTYTLYMKDEVGNIKTINFTTDKLDQTPPTVTINSNESGVLKATLEDIKSGLAGYQFTTEEKEPNDYENVSGITMDIEEKFSTDGIFYLWVKDNVGNITHQQLNVLAKDSEAPHISYEVTPASCTTADWCKDATFNIKVTDDTGIQNVKYCLTTEDICTPDLTASATFSVSAVNSSKAQKVCTLAQDIVGNQTRTICSDAYRIDKEAPHIDFNYFVDGVRLYISALNSYDSESGINGYSYSIDGGKNFETLSTSASYVYDYLEYKDYDVAVKVIDNVGNEAIYKQTITINKPLEDKVKEESTMSNACPTVDSAGNISNVSSTTSSMVCTAPDDYGTSYYYRGAVTDNYVKFAGFYWRILRINGDSSVRMIYAGDAEVIDKLDDATRKKVLSNGYDDSKTNYTSIGQTYFNENWKQANEYLVLGTYYSTKIYAPMYYDNAVVGYMYGNRNGVYEGSEEVGSESFSYSMDDMGIEQSSPDSFISSNEYEIKNNTLTPKLPGSGSIPDIASGNENPVGLYYSPSTAGSSTYLPYLKKILRADEAQYDSNMRRDDRTAYYGITALGTTTAAAAQKNTNSSALKDVIDTWYQNKLSSYTTYLADSLYCNDRSLGSGENFTYSAYNIYTNYLDKINISNLGYGASGTYYHGTDSTYRLKCPNQNDRFTVSNISIGNGSLTYPIGTLTSDEAVLSGIDKTGFLYNKGRYWTMTPYVFHAILYDKPLNSFVGYVDESLIIPTTSTSNNPSKLGVRPVINVKSGLLSVGNGTIDNPYRMQSELEVNDYEVGNNSWYKRLTLQYTPSNLVDSVNYCVTTGESCTPNEEAKLSMGTFKYTFKGNSSAERLCIKDGEETICSDAYLVDPVKPVTNIETTVTDTGISVDLGSSVENESAIVKYYFSRDGKTFTSSTNSTYFYAISENGTYKIYVKTEDKAGNISDVVEKDVTIFRPFSIYSSTSGKNNWYTELTMQVFTLEETDKMNYCVTTDENCTPNKEASLVNKSFNYQFKSNTSAQKICINYNDDVKCSSSYLVDTTKPDAAINVTSDKENVKVSGTGSLDKESGIAYYYFSKNGVDFSSSRYENMNYTFYQNGVYTFYVKVENKAGLMSDIVKMNAKIDVTSKIDEKSFSTDTYVTAGDTYQTDVYRGENYEFYATSSACSNKTSNCRKLHSKGDKVLWRVVELENNVDNGKGIKETRLKLITTENIGNFSWTNVTKGVDDNKTYDTSLLVKLLNPGYESESANNSLYYNSSTGKCYYRGSTSTSSCDFSNIGLRSMKNYISDAVWNTGIISTNDTSESDYSAHEKSSTWTGKVGLISSLNYRNSVSEYEHSRYNGEENKLCHDLSITEWNFYFCDSSCVMGGGSYTNGCKNYSWLSDIYYYNENDSYIDFIGSTMLLNYHNYYGDFSAVRPSVYVSSDAYITEGDGSKSNPYVLGYPKTPEEQIISEVDTASSCPSVSSDGKVDVKNEEVEKNLVCTAPDDYGTSYYYRGNVIDNWVEYAGAYWKILRVNGDKSIRMIYTGKVSDVDSLSESQKKALANNTLEYGDIPNTILNIGRTPYSKEWKINGTNLATNSTTHFDNVGLSFMYGDTTRVETERQDEDADTIWNDEKAFTYADSYSYDETKDRYELNGNITTKAYDELDLDTLVGKYYLNSTYNCNTYNHPTSCQYVIKITSATKNDTSNAIALKYHRIGYASKNQEEIRQNTNNSNIKDALDRWYQSFLSSYTNDLADTLFCNDRSTLSGEGYGLNTASYRGKELFKNKLATLKCSNIKDRFTVNSTKGNQNLTYAIGLITGDELFMAGITNKSSYNIPHNYLATDFYYTSMTPVEAGWLSSIVSFYDSDVNLSNTDSLTYIRPVINLKSGVLKTGNGTFSHPYRVS